MVLSEEGVSFSVDEITNSLDHESRDVICGLVLSWARYDSIISQWTFRSFGMGADEGSILLGNMDTKSKFERLQSLFKHFGNGEAAVSVKRLAAEHQKHVGIRNTVCHVTCAGHVRSEPDRIAFGGGKIFKGKPGVMLVELVHIQQIRDARDFASKSADQIVQLIDLIESKSKHLGSQGA